MLYHIKIIAKLLLIWHNIIWNNYEINFVGCEGGIKNIKGITVIILYF